MQVDRHENGYPVYDPPTGVGPVLLIPEYLEDDNELVEVVDPLDAMDFVVGGEHVYACLGYHVLEDGRVHMGAKLHNCGEIERLRYDTVPAEEARESAWLLVQRAIGAYRREVGDKMLSVVYWDQDHEYFVRCVESAAKRGYGFGTVADIPRIDEEAMSNLLSRGYIQRETLDAVFNLQARQEESRALQEENELLKKSLKAALEENATLRQTLGLEEILFDA